MLFYCPELFSFPLDYTELQITINNKRKIVNNIETPYTIKHIIQARKNLHEMSKYSPWTIWWSELVDLRLHHREPKSNSIWVLFFIVFVPMLRRGDDLLYDSLRFVDGCSSKALLNCTLDHFCFRHIITASPI